MPTQFSATYLIKDADGLEFIIRKKEILFKMTRESKSERQRDVKKFEVPSAVSIQGKGREASGKDSLKTLLKTSCSIPRKPPIGTLIPISFLKLKHRVGVHREIGEECDGLLIIIRIISEPQTNNAFKVYLGFQTASMAPSFTNPDPEFGTIVKK
ncbi:hypothetical protein Tco_1037647 [Tanacetum coccineum]